MPNLLQVENLSKHYGGVSALRNAHFAVLSGEVHALIGENGAGKSTLARILAGSTRPDSGTIFIDGQPASIATPLDAQRSGIGIIYQELDLFRHLSVGENVVIGNLRFRDGRLVRWRRIEAFCRPFLDQVGLACGVRAMVSSLSIGQMQLLAIARALSMNARLVLMDEPTSSLFDDAVERLFGLIRDLKRRGVSIVYVSHKMDEILRVCDRATVLRDGETMGTLEIAQTSADRIIRMMVGRELRIATRPERRGSSEVVLAVEGLTTGKLKGVSFELRRGEVLGVAGLVGSGRSELGAALFGIHRISAGTIRLQGRLVNPRSTREAIRNRFGLLPEDRRLLGLMTRMSVLENGTIALLPRLQAGGFIRRAQEERAMETAARRLGLHYRSLGEPVSRLSGGNQQKVLLARWLLLDPDVLFLDDPARGIDVGAKQDVYRIIDALASAGKGVLLVSSELPELLRCCDRILVLSNGRLRAIYDAKDASPEKIMASATNTESPPEDRP